jgi:hypothetical protein
VKTGRGAQVAGRYQFEGVPLGLIAIRAFGGSYIDVDLLCVMRGGRCSPAVRSVDAVRRPKQVRKHLLWKSRGGEVARGPALGERVEQRLTARGTGLQKRDRLRFLAANRASSQHGQEYK